MSEETLRGHELGPYRSTASHSLALLIRIATGADQWAERDRNHNSDGTD
jgi:hypothetical protein